MTDAFALEKLGQRVPARRSNRVLIEDVPNGFGVPFPRAAKARTGEAVIFSWITYKSRAHRDAVNKKVMADPRLQDAGKAMPFDHKRMSWGGFKTLVDL